MIVLIPAYEPDLRLVAMIEKIVGSNPDQQVLVVDDGSGPAYATVFAAAAAAGAEVIGHPTNRGKGFALRAGFDHVRRRHPGEDVVCADCDGQHTVLDLLRVAAALRQQGDRIVLGARQFAGDVPARSRFGNGVTRVLFGRVTGVPLQDTQTGLRGYPAAMLPWLLGIGGDRFEYELDVLLEARRAGIGFHEVPIETIYLDGNSSSHFRTVRDSIRVYVPLVKFSLSSLAAFAVDAGLFFGLMATTGQLGLSVVGARLVSATVNFTVNRRLVFDGDRSPTASAVRYGSLVVALMGANYALLRVLTTVLPVPLVPAKLLTELALFAASYQVQRRLVFRRTPSSTPPVAAPSDAPTDAPTDARSGAARTVARRLHRQAA